MGFRWRFFLSIALAVLIGAAVEGVLDYSETRQQVASDITDALEETLNYGQSAVDLESSPPRLLDSPAPPPWRSRLRLIQGGVVQLQSGSDFLEGEPLTSASRLLADDSVLEATVDPRFFERSLNERLRSDLLDASYQVVIAVAVALLLASVLLKPIRELTSAVDDLSQQRFPDPVTVPPGNDGFARLARSFNRMSASIKAAMDRERSFTHYASHELRTPLSAIKLQTESLEMGMASTEEVVPVLTQQIDRMQRVLEALLSLAHASEQTAEPISVTSIAVETIRAFPESQRLRIHLDDRLDTPVKVASPYLVGQAILNLLDNALKYTDDTVTLSLARDGDSVTARVRDRGMGVPEKVLDKLTDSFFRFDLHVGGNGLGLALVKHIAQAFGGDLDLRNTENGFEAILQTPVATG